MEKKYQGDFVITVYSCKPLRRAEFHEAEILQELSRLRNDLEHVISGKKVSVSDEDVESGNGFLCLLPNIWVFPKIVVPQNGWFIRENPIRIIRIRW